MLNEPTDLPPFSAHFRVGIGFDSRRLHQNSRLCTPPCATKCANGGVQSLADYAAKVRARLTVDPETGCHLWTGARDRRGYGRVLCGKKPDGRRRLDGPHRVILAEKLGRDPGPDEDACHTCDNPSCCNPDHLFAGSRGDNMRDCRDKGRLANPTRKLTRYDVGHIRLLREGGRTYAAIAREMGVDPSTVRRAAKGESHA